MKNLEKIEAYFNNELNDSKKNDFLSEVESNSELKSEFDFQKEIINGIKEVRKAELKAMLNEVPVASVSTAANGLYKILFGGTATILLGTAIWYYTNSENSIAPLPTTEVEVSNRVIGKENNLSEAKSESKSTPITSNQIAKRKDAALPKEEEISPVIVPNVPTSEDELDANIITEENLEIPESVNNSSINLSSKVDVEIKLKKKYNFHYQYSEKGIVLYGEFKEGLFEILELNKEDSIHYYLFFKGNYYYINDKSGNITPLKEIKDKKLQLKLKGLR